MVKLLNELLKIFVIVNQLPQNDFFSFTFTKLNIRRHFFTIYLPFINTINQLLSKRLISYKKYQPKIEECTLMGTISGPDGRAIEQEETGEES